jgi:hypothetical protein
MSAISEFITADALVPYAPMSALSEFITGTALTPYATTEWVIGEDFAGTEDVEDVLDLVEEAVALTDVVYIDGQGDVVVEGVNLRLVNGTGSTDTINGTGPLWARPLLLGDRLIRSR